MHDSSIYSIIGALVSAGLVFYALYKFNKVSKESENLK